MRRVAAAPRRQRQHAAERDVVQIVADHLRQRPGLAPAGHAAVDQPRVALGAVGRAQAQALHHAGPVAFDQRVGLGDEVERGGAVGRALEVERDDLLAVEQPIAAGAAELLGHRIATRAADHRDLRAQAGQHPAGQRAGAEALEFDDADGMKRVVQGLGWRLGHGWVLLWRWSTASLIRPSSPQANSWCARRASLTV